jgi:3,4-dihydroxy 2-butanone 4-phosphate synthase/GTP cyclohydrolase II
MNDDGTMARMPDLVAFAKHHGLKVTTIADLIAYRRKHDSIVRRVAETEVTSAFGGKFAMRLYRTTVEPTEEHIALVKGDISKGGPVLVRVHACNTLSDILGVNDKGYATSLVHKAMELISDEGRGVLVLIRDIWPRAVSDALESEKEEGGAQDAPQNRLLEIGIGSQILHDLGVRDMILLSNSPQRRVVGLEGYGLRITDYRRLE